MKRVTIKWKEDQIIKKDICFECGCDSNIHYHHVVPNALGGKKTLPLCEKCHGKVHGKVMMFKLQRIGINKAKEDGKYKGRSCGAKMNLERYLNTSKVLQITELLGIKISLREIAKKVPCSVNTVRRVNKILNIR